MALGLRGFRLGGFPLPRFSPLDDQDAGAPDSLLPFFLRPPRCREWPRSPAGRASVMPGTETPPAPAFAK